MDEEMNLGELLKATSEENQTQKDSRNPEIQHKSG